MDLGSIMAGSLFLSSSFSAVHCFRELLDNIVDDTYFTEFEKAKKRVFGIYTSILAGCYFVPAYDGFEYFAHLITK